ncbi:YbaK/EbsC family protein [Thermovenabulum gondwanense]|uniref:Proline--tRNA ligase n=1 Tax=Thermovenabulum gondwanense TaxID=520767 RepID=A0A162MF31_9FIRM|nr:YbaK/EbsC family protein [Thermovenabulum gondwanense]KYO65526.1 Proline--tRNA ligase [Thermovenabulum gondwanense]
MGILEAKEYLKKWGRDRDVLEFNQSSATVEEAAKAANVEPARIAKTLAFRDKENGAMLIVTAGDVKIDNAKFKKEFGFKARMLSHEETFEITGHPVGGVCPFGLKSDIPVYLDVSLKRFKTVLPACGSGNSAIELTCEELELYAKSKRWVDACR